MKIFDYFRNKKQQKSKYPKSVVPEYSEQIEIINREIETLFPTSGYWSTSCYQRPTKLVKQNLPCHLRDNEWLSEYMEYQLYEKGINISPITIKSVMDKSERFNELRHNYEQEIVRWQINWMKDGGGHWLMPEGYDEISLLISTSVDKMFRKGVEKTLSAIGLAKDAIEEGIEKNAEIWRDKFMNLSFDHAFEPVFYDKPAPAKATDKHRENWLKLRKYEYYKDHKDSVDKYGEVTPEMKLEEPEAEILKATVLKQNAERYKLLQDWENNTPKQNNSYNIM